MRSFSTCYLCLSGEDYQIMQAMESWLQLEMD